MPVSLIIYLIFGIGGGILLGVGMILISRYRKKKRRQKANFNSIRVGMKEQDLYRLCGTPKETFEVDSTSKVVTFIEKVWGIIFVDSVVAQVSIKDGIVTNVEIK